MRNLIFQMLDLAYAAQVCPYMVCISISILQSSNACVIGDIYLSFEVYHSMYQCTYY